MWLSGEEWSRMPNGRGCNMQQALMMLTNTAAPSDAQMATS